jgi:endoglycosylceramidase
MPSCSRRCLVAAVVTVTAAVAVGCAPDDVVVPDATGPVAPFHVEGSAIVDAEGARVLLRGVNLSQSAKNAPFHPTELDDADARATLRAHGPLTLRYLTSWAAIEPEDGHYDDAYLAALADRVSALADDGHLIVLDLHQDLFGTGFVGGNGAPPFACDQQHYDDFVYVDPWFNNYQSPQMKACFDGLFADDARLARMATALRRVTDVVKAAAGDHFIGVDLINEPHPGSSDGVTFDARLARYYSLAADALDGSGVLPFFEPNVTHNLGEATHLSEAPVPNSVYAPHLYPFDVELGTYNDTNGLRAQVEHFVAEAEGFGVPLFVGELGPKPNDPGAGLFVDDALAFLDDAVAGATFWDWSAQSDRGFLRDDVGDTPRRALRPHGRRLAGEVRVHTFDPVDGHLEIVLGENGSSATSEIVWPAVWGAIDDVDVEVSDGAVKVDAAAGVIVWVHDGSVDEHRLVARLRP